MRLLRRLRVSSSPHTPTRALPATTPQQSHFARPPARPQLWRRGTLFYVIHESKHLSVSSRIAAHGEVRVGGRGGWHVAASVAGMEAGGGGVHGARGEGKVGARSEGSVAR